MLIRCGIVDTQVKFRTETSVVFIPQYHIHFNKQLTLELHKFTYTLIFFNKYMQYYTIQG